MLKLVTTSLSSVCAAAALPLKLAAGTLTAIGRTVFENGSVHSHRPSRESGLKLCEGHRPYRTDDTPVLLIPGYLSPHVSWHSLVQELHLNGFSNVVCLRYNPFRMDIPAIASILAAEARRAMLRSGSPRVHLVGYSLGGLAVRYAVQRLGMTDEVLSAVTVATPHKGSPLAHLGVGPAVRQLRSNSPFLSALPDIDMSHKVRWSLIGSRSDLVVPLSSATAGRHVSSSSLPGPGHLLIMNSPELADAVVRRLKDARSEAIGGQDVRRRPLTAEAGLKAS
ncbi:esterase/lipase family protein [Streptomyces sp. NPDC059785]